MHALHTCDVISRALRHAHTYRVATQQRRAWLIYVCINYSARGNACAYWYVLRFSHHVAIWICIIKPHARAVVCSRDYPCSKHDDHDDDKMNTLAFVNFLLVKFFPTLIRRYFPPSKFCAIYGSYAQYFAHHQLICSKV